MERHGKRGEGIGNYVIENRKRENMDKMWNTENGRSDKKKFLQ